MTYCYWLLYDRFYLQIFQIEKYAGGRDKKSLVSYVAKMESPKPGADSEEEKVPEKKIAEEPADDDDEDVIYL